MSGEQLLSSPVRGSANATSAAITARCTVSRDRFGAGRLGGRRQCQAVLTHARSELEKSSDHLQGALQQAHHGQVAVGSVGFTGQFVVAGESA